MEPAKGKDKEGLSIFTVAMSLLSICIAVAAIIVAVSAGDDGGSTASASSGGPVTVSLTEFAIDPDPISVGAGATLTVVNDGTTAHNLAVKDEDMTTPDLSAGDSGSLDLGDLAAGDYTVICTVAGHEQSGMSATLTIGEGEGAASGDQPADEPMDFNEMDELVAARTAMFPAKTSGTGATDLEPVIAADGAKEFELTASVFDWELEPGKVVQAWGYNEQVPGPTIRVEVGDTVRIILHNELEESTVLHSHGFTVPNKMDGVPDITQLAIKPGDSFTYEFVVKEPMVGMYHSHHNAQIQVPNGMLGAFYAGHMPVPAGTPANVAEVPMVLNDAGVIGLSLNGKSFPATAPIVAKQGDWVRLDYMNEGLLVHPMHLHGVPQLVIAKDGYPLANPSMEDTVTVAPGERVSVLVHATEVGAWAWHCHILNHAERPDGMFGMVTALIVE